MGDCHGVDFREESELSSERSSDLFSSRNRSLERGKGWVEDPGSTGLFKTSIEWVQKETVQKLGVFGGNL